MRGLAHPLKPLLHVGTPDLDQCFDSFIQIALPPVVSSDEYLTAQVETADIFEVEYVVKKSLPEKFGVASQEAMDRLLLKWWERLHNSRFFS